MRKFFLLFVLLSFCYSMGIAQNSGSKRSFSDRIQVGGNMGLNFGTITFVNLSPRIGYLVTDDFTLGLGATYQYTKDNRINYSSSIYGGSAFARHNITPELFAHAEYEQLQWKPFLNAGTTQEGLKINVPVFLIGGGYRQALGGGSFISLMALYDVIQDPYSPYPVLSEDLPIVFRVGIMAGL